MVSYSLSSLIGLVVLTICASASHVEIPGTYWASFASLEHESVSLDRDAFMQQLDDISGLSLSGKSPFAVSLVGRPKTVVFALYSAAPRSSKNFVLLTDDVSVLDVVEEHLAKVVKVYGDKNAVGVWEARTSSSAPAVIVAFPQEGSSFVDVVHASIPDALVVSIYGVKDPLVEESSRRVLGESSFSDGAQGPFRDTDYLIMVWVGVTLIVILFAVFCCVSWEVPLDPILTAAVKLGKDSSKKDL